MERFIVTVLMAKSLIGVGGAVLAVGGCLTEGHLLALFPAYC